MTGRSCADEVKSKGTFISKSHTFYCYIKYSSDMLSINILISLQLFIRGKRIKSFVTIEFPVSLLRKHEGSHNQLFNKRDLVLTMQFANQLCMTCIALYALLSIAINLLVI